MQKFSADEAARIIAESRETLSRDPFSPSAKVVERDHHATVDDGPADPPIETRNARHIREIQERDRQWARERVANAPRMTSPSITRSPRCGPNSRSCAST
jgi:hypothetical protein